MDEQRTALVAGSLLSAMVHSAETGHLDGFRIITAQHWIDLGARMHAGKVPELSLLDLRSLAKAW